MTTATDSRFPDLTTLATTIGQFWTEIFEDRELVLDLLRGFAQQERQIDQLSEELYDGVNRFSCPIYHTDIWLPLTLLETDLVATTLAENEDALIYGENTDATLSYAYGAPWSDAVACPIDAQIVRAPLLATSPVQPETLLTYGIDFFIHNQRLVFAFNPFNDSRFTPVTEDGVRSLTIYLYNAQSDRELFQKLHGYILKIPGTSSENYKSTVNALLDGIACATSANDLRSFLAALTDVPAVRETTETVEVVTEDGEFLLIITDQHVYKFSKDSVALVTVGQTVKRGDFMVDTIRLVEPNTGEIPSFVTQLSVGRGLLTPAISNELIFKNEEVPLTVTEGVSGYTKVTFPLGGFSADVTAFFDEIHERGVAATETLANHLDLREAPSTEPNASNLPATINPLQFLLENLLKYNTMFLAVKTNEFGKNSLGLDRISLLRKIMPPHVAILIFAELALDEEEITLDEDGDSEDPGVLEEYEIFVPA